MCGAALKGRFPPTLSSHHKKSEFIKAMQRKATIKKKPNKNSIQHLIWGIKIPASALLLPQDVALKQTLGLVLPQGAAGTDTVHVTDGASTRAGRTRDVTPGVTQPTRDGGRLCGNLTSSCLLLGRRR